MHINFGVFDGMLNGTGFVINAMVVNLIRRISVVMK